MNKTIKQIKLKWWWQVLILLATSPFVALLIYGIIQGDYKITGVNSILILLLFGILTTLAQWGFNSIFIRSSKGWLNRGKDNEYKPNYNGLLLATEAEFIVMVIIAMFSIFLLPEMLAIIIIVAAAFTTLGFVYYWVSGGDKQRSWTLVLVSTVIAIVNLFIGR